MKTVLTFVSVWPPPIHRAYRVRDPPRDRDRDHDRGHGGRRVYAHHVYAHHVYASCLSFSHL